MSARVIACGSSGVDEKRAEWVPLDPGDEPSEGARLAVVGGAAGVNVLIVELDAGGFISKHATPEVSVCHVVEGSGAVVLSSGEEIPFTRGDTIEFAGDVPHAWRGGSERTLVAVTTFPAAAQ
jgi:quercetin dioxygenase-like cupin family protein